MSKIAMIGSFLSVSIVLSLGGCNITSCEEGAYCGEDAAGEKQKDDDRREQCGQLCGRLSECGAPQADDLDDCIDTCRDRFEIIPEKTGELCACAEESSCADLMEGRCSAHGSGGSGGSGGSNAYGGSSNQGGSPGTGGAPAKGGTSASGGSATTGGASSSGGAPATGGTAGSDPGACTGGTTATGGSDAGGAGGEDPGIACTCNCQCASGQTCVDGYCSA